MSAIQARSADSVSSPGARASSRSLKERSAKGSAANSRSSFAGKCSVTVRGATSAASAMALIVVARKPSRANRSSAACWIAARVRCLRRS